VLRIFQRHFAHDHRDDFRAGVEPLEDCHQLLPFAAADQVDLADQDDVGEFDLLDQQVGDRTFLFAKVSPRESRLSAAW
jgi:hypothetical protein